jgi:hypothetical protein
MLSELVPGLVSARRAAALQQIAQAKQSQDPSEVLVLLRAAEKFFSGSRPQLSQQIANLEAEEAQFRKRLSKAEANASKPAQELEPEREPEREPEPQPEPEAEPPEPATRSVEAQGQTDALMNSSAEKKAKKRKQKPRKQHAVSWQVAEERPPAGGGSRDVVAATAAAEEETAVMPTSTPEATQNDKAKAAAEATAKVEAEAEAEAGAKAKAKAETKRQRQWAKRAAAKAGTRDARQGGNGENEHIEGTANTYGAAEIEPEPEEPELEPEKTYITGAEMGTWDEGVVAAWLTASAHLGAPELAAALSVELDGADLVEATDAMLKGLCKKASRQLAMGRRIIRVVYFAWRIANEIY